MCSLQPDRTLFAKNSDRPPGEAQVVELHPARPAGGELRTQHLTIDDAGSYALVGSRPTWMWGLEHGVNEHRLAIGNEQLWTVDDPRLEPDGLTGLDLVRLGLERARSAAEAVTVITGLIEAHGQGGIADRDEAKAYYSSFLLADPSEAWALETSSRSWAARRIEPGEGGAALSNRISLSTTWTAASPDVAAAGDFDRWRRASSPTAHADKRLAVTGAAVQSAPAPSAADLAGVLRDHGGRPWGRPGDDAGMIAPLPPPVIDRSGTGVSVCMHLRHVQATTAAMVASLPRDPAEPVRVWVALGSPCTSVFVPAMPFGAGGGVPPELGDEATWQRFRALRDRVEAARDNSSDDSERELTTIRRTLGPVEARLWADADRAAACGSSDSAVDGPSDSAVDGPGDWAAVDAGLAALDV